MWVFDYLFLRSQKTFPSIQAKSRLTETTIFSFLFHIGIRPETHSPGMFSWFPILFPIKVGITFYTQWVKEATFAIGILPLPYSQNDA